MRSGRPRHYRIDPLEDRRLLAQVTWDGGAGTQAWTDPLNWSTDSLPGPADDVVIDVPASNAAISLWNTTASVRSLTSTEELNTSGATLSLAAASSLSTLVMGGNLASTIGGAGDLTINSSSTWRNGTFAGTGKLIISPGVTLSIDPYNSLQRVLSRVAENYGTLRWYETATLHFNGGTLINRGTLSHTSPITTPLRIHTYAALSGTNQIINQGTVVGGVLPDVKFAVPFVNDVGGLVTIPSGTIYFQAGLDNRSTIDVGMDGRLKIQSEVVHSPTSIIKGIGRVDFDSGTHTVGSWYSQFTGLTCVYSPSAVTFNVAPVEVSVVAGQTTFNVPMTFTKLGGGAGGTVVFNQPVTGSGALSFSGNVRFNSTTSTTFTSIYSNGTLVFTQPTTLNIGSLTVYGTLDTPADINVTTELGWGGSVIGAGTLTIAAGALGHLYSGSNLSLGRRFVNLGTVRHQSSNSISLLDGSQFENHGTFETGAGNSGGVSGNGSFINYGLMRNELTTGLTFSAMLDNRGQVSIGSNSGGFLFTRSTGTALINQGTITLATGGRMSVRTMSQLPGSMISGTGTFTLAGGQNTLVSSTIADTLIFRFSGGTTYVNLPITLGSTTTNYYDIGGEVIFNAPATILNRLRTTGTTTFHAVPSFGNTVYIGTTTAAGTLVINVDMDIPSLELSNGTLKGTGNINVTQSLVSQSGFLDGTGILRLGSAVSANLNGLLIRQTLVNDGTLQLATDGSFSLANGTLVNSGLLNVNVSLTSAHILASGGENRFVNNGLLQHSGTGTLFIDVPIENNGTVAVNSGLLQVTAGLGDGTSTALAGTWLALPNTQLRFSHNVLSVSGTLKVYANAQLNGLPSLRSNSGTIEVRQGANFAIAPASPFINSGTLQISAGSMMNVIGDLQFAGNGRVVTEITAFNSGGVGRLAVTGTVNLESTGGRSSVVAVPVAGDLPPSSPVVFLQAGLLSGALDAFSAPASASGRAIHLQRAANSLTLRMSEGPASDLPTPQVVTSQFEFDSRQAIRLTFNTDVAAFLSRDDLVLQNTATGQTISVGTLNYAPLSRTAVLEFTNLLGNGDYRLTVRDADVANPAGTPLQPAAAVDFYILAGDANRDRVVDFADLLIVSQNYGQTGLGFGAGNLNYSADGAVNFDDVLVLVQNYGVSLPGTLQVGGKKRDRTANVIAIRALS